MKTCPGVQENSASKSLRQRLPSHALFHLRRGGRRLRRRRVRRLSRVDRAEILGADVSGTVVLAVASVAVHLEVVRRGAGRRAEVRRDGHLSFGDLFDEFLGWNASSSRTGPGSSSYTSAVVAV